jgi:hypothetical protein
MAHDDLLASWHDTSSRAAITGFVDAATGDGAEAVPSEERVATTGATTAT